MLLSKFEPGSGFTVQVILSGQLISVKCFEIAGIGILAQIFFSRFIAFFCLGWVAFCLSVFKESLLLI